MTSCLEVLAADTQSVDFKRVKQRLEALQQNRGQSQPPGSEGADGQRLAATTVSTREVVLIVFERGIQALPVGQLAAAHQASPLEQLESSIHGGQALLLLSGLQPLVKPPGTQFAPCLPQHLQKMVLPGTR
jgi:hypothetical protein